MSSFNSATSSPMPKANRLNAPSQPTSAPSPTPSNSSNMGGTKRKRPDINITYSQPMLTGTGESLLSKVHYALRYLQDKGTWLSFQEILNYCFANGEITDNVRHAFKRVITSHDRVEYDPAANKGKGAYRFKPKHNVRNADELRAYLQKRPNAQGISVKELKEGWPDAVKSIDLLEKRGELLVTRMKKDNAPKMVWQNDPTLTYNIEPEFKNAWHSIQLPANMDELRSKLEAAGLKPTSASKDPNAVVKPKEKKRKTTRKSGKQTNVHMVGILRDYSHKRK
ncbi:transcription initiation factor IIE subunit beta [Patellaria atrata CBS 101060]|uniref:Transcription initiation factor IIE subunit beta n=1 Tax=Patellaria atrata CBS 101060 TaxID=1346257 RepID=A0A9P4SG99_9PEZI|nr:transcription initiation factor IIE subunit beta [Patellaria atrata CBS 101060]